MTARRTLCLVVLAAAAAVSAPSFATSSAAPSAQSTYVVGKQLYRQFCGKCHALSQALSAGFGNNTNGIGANGGPSFNDLSVAYKYSIQAITEPTGGHEIVRTKLTAKQVAEVASFLAKATRGHPIPALPTDG